nr:ankyrin repeat-containing protein At5g02620-like [Ipomoea batatas]
MEMQLNFGGERKRGKDSPGKRSDKTLHLAARAGNLRKVREILQRFDSKTIKDMVSKQNQEGQILELRPIVQAFTITRDLLGKSFSSTILSSPTLASSSSCRRLIALGLLRSSAIVHSIHVYEIEANLEERGEGERRKKSCLRIRRREGHSLRTIGDMFHGVEPRPVGENVVVSFKDELGGGGRRDHHHGYAA